MGFNNSSNGASTAPHAANVANSMLCGMPAMMLRPVEAHPTRDTIILLKESDGPQSGMHGTWLAAQPLTEFQSEVCPKSGAHVDDRILVRRLSQVGCALNTIKGVGPQAERIHLLEPMALMNT